MCRNACANKKTAINTNINPDHPSRVEQDLQVQGSGG